MVFIKTNELYIFSQSLVAVLERIGRMRHISENPFAGRINNAKKYVASKTLTKLDWTILN